MFSQKDFFFTTVCFFFKKYSIYFRICVQNFKNKWHFFFLNYKNIHLNNLFGLKYDFRI